MTLAEALRLATMRLTTAGVETAAKDARVLLAHAHGIAPDRLMLHLGDSADVALLEPLLAAREARQPVAQIVGYRLFWGRRFRVTRDTLDPRPETETLIAEALSRPFASVLDLGTGTGAIVLTLMAETGARGMATDLSPDALAVAKVNAVDLGLAPEFMLSDWFGHVDGRFDLIVSNPPYIAEAEMEDLSRDVLGWEPHMALTPGGDGLAAYRAIAAGVSEHLNANGRVLLEIGPTQGRAVCDLLAQAGLENVAIHTDMDGRDRVVSAEAKKTREKLPNA